MTVFRVKVCISRGPEAGREACSEVDGNDGTAGTWLMVRILREGYGLELESVPGSGLGVTLVSAWWSGLGLGGGRVRCREFLRWIPCGLEAGEREQRERPFFR